MNSAGDALIAPANVMPAASAVRRHQPLAGLALIAAAALLGTSAWWQLFTTFKFWDDEGYVLISLRNFGAGHALYTEVFSQYGPLYNLLFGLAHRYLALPLDAESARWIVALLWVTATLLSGFAVRRLTGSWLWAATGAAAVFTLLRLLTHEPLHPVALISFLLTSGTAGAVANISGDRMRAGCVIAATTGALLALVKINVGLFYLAGAATFAVWSASTALARNWARIVLIAVAILAGAALMRAVIDQPWVRQFFIVYAFAAATMLTVFALEIRADQPWREVIAVPLAAALSGMVFVLGCAILAGIKPLQLIDGMLIAPLRQPIAFTFPFRWSGLTNFGLIANAIGFAAWLSLRRTRPIAASFLVAVWRIVAGAGFLVSYFHGFAVTIEAYLLSFGTGFLWALAAPLGELPDSARRARQLLGMLALFQVLHAFPVAGTQVNVGTLLLAIWIVVSLADVVHWLIAAYGARSIRLMARAGAWGALALTVWGFSRLTVSAARDYFQHSAERFTGARLHLSPWQSSTFATLSANARHHGDVLFSLPGMFSFNLWTGLPTPTRANITQWWSFLNDAQQSAIAGRLGSADRPVVLVQRNLITSSGLAETSYHPSTLTRYFDQNFKKLFSLDSYEFWIRRDRELSPIHIGRWSKDESANGFSFHSLEASMPSVAHVEFLDFQLGSTRIVAKEYAAITSTGVHDAHLTRWHCQLSVPSPLPQSQCDAARFIAGDGSVILEVRFERPAPQANPR